MRFENKVVLVTGGGSGIGRATALRFADEGATLVVADVDDAAAGGLMNELGKRGRAVFVVGSVAVREDVERMVNQALTSFGRLDIVINNAGITRDALTVRIKDGDVKRMSEEQWDAVLDVNLKGTFLVSQAAAVPMMEQKFGRIVNTASVGALGNIGQANYSASKAGVIGLTKTFALEWARFNITVNAVAPGAVKTRMTSTIPENIANQMSEKIPLKRWAEPEDIAAVHAFLASDDARYITGQVIWVDGGLSVGV